MPAPTERASTEPAPTESVFARMTRLSAQRGAVNLGQGFPSDPAPDFLLSALRQAPGHTDQYTGPAGLPALRESLEADLGVPAEDLLVTCGATEALLVALLALVEPGDEVLFFEPAFDIYGPQVRLAGGVPVPVPLTFGPGGWAPDWEGLRAAVTGRTRILLLNNPLNPTGSVFNEADLAGVAALAREHDFWLLADEVYDELYFDSPPTPLRRLAPERTFSVGSAGKRLGVTGWRVGWVATPPGESAELLRVRQLSSFCAPAPLQAAVAVGLAAARGEGFYEWQRQEYSERCALLAGGLRSLGAEVYPPGGTYFLTARAPGWDAERLVHEAGVALIPVSAFCTRLTPPPELLRAAFCKSRLDIEQALERLAAWRP